MNKEKVIKVLKFLGICIISYCGIFILNNIRNIINIILKSNKGITFISIPIILSLIIFMFYIYKVKKKNKYFNIAFILMLLFYNTCNGVFYSADINTFFILYVILLIFTFRLYLNNKNFSLSLIAGFSITILLTLIIGLLGMLKLVKYLLVIYAIYNLIYFYKNQKRLNIKNNLNNFFDKELLMFTILFIIAIVGGVGRFVHVYDEYSHWAYDAKAVINYDKFTTSKEIMSKSRGYAPILTSWYYITSQFSKGFNESNLYISLAIFISIYLMSITINKKNNNYSFFSIIFAYMSCFILGGVYSFDNLYADLAFGAVFGATLITIFIKDDNKKILMIPLLILLTLIKPSGCTASFTILLIIMLKYFVDNSSKKLNEKIKNFMKEYWKYILATIVCFIGWRLYVAITSKINTEFFTLDLRPRGLYSDLADKLNKNFISNFISLIINTFDEQLLFGNINITLYQFLIIIFTLLFILIKQINNNYNKTIKYTIILLFSYIVFFALTTFSIFYALSYYEATIIASFGRYLNSIHIAFIMLALYLFNQLYNDKKYSSQTLVILLISLTLLTNSKQVFYFVLDIKERNATHEISDKLSDKFTELNNKTSKNSKVFVIDQEDRDGIMAMWYARYYAFPRKINASSLAIAWKVKTEKNKDDLQDWGLTRDKFLAELKKEKFEYLYFYSIDDEFINLLKDEFVKYDSKSKVYKIIYKEKKIKFEPVYNIIK